MHILGCNLLICGSYTTAISVGSALVSSRLDLLIRYCSRLSTEALAKATARLQRVQKVLATVVTQQSSSSPLTSKHIEHDNVFHNRVNLVQL